MSGFLQSQKHQLEQLQVRNQEYPIPEHLMHEVDVTNANVLVLAGTTLTDDINSYTLITTRAKSLTVVPIDAYAKMDIEKRFNNNIKTEIESTMNNLTIVANPPYNDGSVGRAPIYHKFLDLAISYKPSVSVFIIPTNWFSQDHNSFGKLVRTQLRTLGVHKIVVNPVDMFKNAKVSTCTVYCMSGYTGQVTLIEKSSGLTRVLDDFNKQIIPEFDEVVLNFLDRIKPKNPYSTFPKGGDVDVSKWRVGTSYKKENYHIDPINPWKVIPPNHPGQNGYRIIASYDSEAEAKLASEKINSWWLSKPILFILRKTRNSTTLDGPQMRYVPSNDYTKVLTADDVNSILQLTAEEKKVIYG